jgi:hypothetical protein
MRNPEFLRELRRDGRMMRHHPESDALGDWVEAMIDRDDWSPFGAP